MKKFTFIILLVSTLKIYAQENYNSESFEVAREDVESRTFKKDSTTNALVIYESGNSYFIKNGRYLITKVKKKIKIFNKNDEVTTVKIYLYKNGREKEKVQDIEAFIYNIEDGEVISQKLDESNIFEEQFDENYSVIKFTFSNVKEGSVIKYSYTLQSPYIYKFKGWSFQENIPKLFSIYETKIPKSLDYNIKLIGLLKLFNEEYSIEKNCQKITINANYNLYSNSDCIKSIYLMKNIPAFIEEDFMAAEKDYISRLDFELKNYFNQGYTKTWKDVDDMLKKNEHIGEQLSKKINLKSFLKNDVIDERDPKIKAKEIYRYVQQNFTWNDEFKIFTDTSVKDLIKDRSGNLSSLNVLLHNMLKEAGIEVKPVLLSTRENGLPTKLHPVLSDFNYLIVEAEIDDQKYLLDATDKYLLFGELPFRCLNQYARLLDFENGSRWIDITPQTQSKVLYNVEMNFDEEQKLIGKVKSKRTGYHALKYKKAYYPNPDSYIEKLTNNAPFLEIFNHDVQSENSQSEDFDEEYDIEYIPEDTGENLYLNPFFIKFFTENPFKLQERTYPIDFGYKDSYLYMFKLNLGDNYTLVEKPEDLRLVLPNNTGDLTFSVSIMGNQIALFFKFDFKSEIYSPNYYSSLKEYMSKIVGIQKNSLMLLKRK